MDWKYLLFISMNVIKRHHRPRLSSLPIMYPLNQESPEAARKMSHLFDETSRKLDNNARDRFGCLTAACPVLYSISVPGAIRLLTMGLARPLFVQSHSFMFKLRLDTIVSFFPISCAKLPTKKIHIF